MLDLGAVVVFVSSASVGLNLCCKAWRLSLQTSQILTEVENVSSPNKLGQTLTDLTALRVCGVP